MTKRPEELSKTLEITTVTLRAYIKQGKLEGRKAGGKMKKQVIVFVLVVACLHAISFSQIDSATEWFERAGSKYERKDYQGAVADYTQAISLKPDYAPAYLLRGIAKAFLEDYQGAVADFTQAIDLKPDYADAYLARGLAKAELKDYQGAVADYTQAISLKPDSASAYFRRGAARLLPIPIRPLRQK